jgi:hypothetical protein
MAGADSADPTDRDASPVDGGRWNPAGGRVTGPNYFTYVGPRYGPILWRDDCATIEVLRDPGDLAPIGTARPVGRTEGGIAIWQIIIGQAAVPGRWIVLGREFVPLPPWCSHAMSYFANIGPRLGPIMGRHRLVSIGVLQAPDDRAPIGMALAIGRDDDDVEVWELTVRGVELHGRWVVVDREFRPAR